MKALAVFIALLNAHAFAEEARVADLLRLSRQYSDLVDTTKGTAARGHAEQALEYARRAVALEPANAKAHLSVAVCYGKLTEFVGNKTKIEYSRFVRDEALKAVALDPNDDFAWHVLGRWHHGVSEVGGVMRAMAKMVYGALPPASAEEAVKCLQKAAALAPRRIIHRSELARIYAAQKKPELAAKEWQAVLALPLADKGDAADQREARAALGH